MFRPVRPFSPDLDFHDRSEVWNLELADSSPTRHYHQSLREIACVASAPSLATNVKSSAAPPIVSMPSITLTRGATGRTSFQGTWRQFLDLERTVQIKFLSPRDADSNGREPEEFSAAIED